ncbi:MULTISPECIES: extracellular solute-binding protein [Novosphingobium]|jgi:multiple sugar transport system substrate-binding protein|uniref:extracellular solute-binding protein n=1 Tax=Novosphingobium TaxID=165696 RepID=UPI0022F28D53|nr:extracellular solute-binding protein [Novosphingobium resinovorum]GLK44868.1 membrane protein [Novosphingobium resinovorum]
MSTPAYRGLTWDHPRGYRALEAAAAIVAPTHGLSIAWDRHPLEGFESHPIADLAQRYDLIVLDHPHVGEAVAHDCLLPMEQVIGTDAVAALEPAAIGPSLVSYRYGGQHWALPLDAASQVMAYAPARVGTPPQTWEEVTALAPREPVALSLSGPHAALTFQSIVASLHAGGRPEGRFVDPHTGREAYELMARLTGDATRARIDQNPIALLEALSNGEDIALVPLVYGYVNYARSGVAFADAPRGAAAIGSILGGTGIAVSRRCAVTDELRAHLLWLMSEEAQTAFIPAHEGQPALRAAWADRQVDAAWNGFYSSTRATLEAASLRPRHDGAIAFQTEASARLRESLLAQEAAATVLAGIEAAYTRHHTRGTET